MTVEATTDIRGEARLIDTVLAVQLVLEADKLHGMRSRTLAMLHWLLDSVDDLEPNATVPTRLFIEAIKATESDPA